MTEWKITSNVIDGKLMYSVYRNLKDDEPDHSGNREYGMPYILSKSEAIGVCNSLNDEKFTIRDL